MLKSLKGSLLVLFVGLVFIGQNALAKEKVIYGEDDRQDVIDAADEYAKWADSTAAMIAKEKLSWDQEKEVYKVSGKTLQEGGMCGSERFHDQKTAAMCSGFLVGPDILVTAGHCVRSQYTCESFSWVFNYRINKDSSLNYQVTKDQVFNCKKLIKQVLNFDDKNDYAVIQLDRPVPNVKPLPFRKGGTLEEDAPLVVIGHPIGLPTKVADSANVRSISDSIYFVANLDTYGGNSGSAVFNASTGEVEGILVRGEMDFTWSNTGNCRESKRCSNDDCRGEDVTRITNLKEVLSSVLSI